jgi:hypothetical protein
MAVVSKAEGRVLAAEAGFQLGETFVVLIEGAVQGGFGAVGKVVEVLSAALEGGAGAAEDGVGVEGGEALMEAEKVVGVGAGEACLEAKKAIGNAVLGVGEEFGGGGGGGGVEVGGCVGDGGISGVADAGDDGEGAGVDGAGDDFGVEAVQVFPGAAATGYEDYVGVVGMGVKPADACGDFGGAIRALHGGWVDEEIDGGVAAAADLDDVAEGGALEAGDDSYAVREGREGAIVVE